MRSNIELTEQAWRECERGDFMLWIAKRRNVDLRILTLAKARCARLAGNLIKDQRSIEELEFGNSDATIEELNAAAYAAARNEILKKCADICRDTIPFSELKIEGYHESA